MKRKHVLICDSEVHPELRAYFVWYGETDRDQKSLTKMQLNASKSSDIYFRRYDLEVCDFLSHLAEYLFPFLSVYDACLKFRLRNMKTITPVEATKIVRDFLSSPANPQRQKPKAL